MGRESRSAGIVVVVAIAAWTACSPAEDGRRIAVPPGPVRLVDEVGAATIEGPITTVAPIASLESLGDAPREVVLAEGFDDFDPAALSWPAQAGTLQQLGERSAYVVHRSTWNSQYGWTVAAEPGSDYLLERVVRADAPLDVDFVVLESGDDGVPIAEHWPREPMVDGTWQKGAVSFRTTQSTTHLAVVVRATARRRADLLRWGTGRDAGRDVAFDEVRLERVRPTAVQRIGLMKTVALADGADPALGIVKRGQLPPHDVVTQHRTERDGNWAETDALYAPPPTDLVFPLRLGDGVVLQLAACLAQETPRGDAARFEVAVRSEQGERTLWQQELVADGAAWRWHDAEIELGVFAGRDVDLVLRTVATKGQPQPMWGHPILDVAAPPGALRHVILIAVDTLRADRLSCYGYGKPTSPHLDALAHDGVRFDQVAANANWTSPSFASIFTGVVPATHGVFGFGPELPLRQAFVTLAERFRAHGWRTAAIAYKSPLYRGGFDQGFDVALNVPREVVTGDDNLAEAMTWLDRDAPYRSFLFLHFDDPHQPFNEPPPFDRAFGPHPSALGMSIVAALPSDTVEPRDPRVRAVLRAQYDGEVGFVDDRIGAFLQALRDRGLYDDTLIAFVADHGEQLWEHGKFGHGAEMLHDEVVRVPLIVKPAGGDFERGRVVSSQVSAFDVMPTLLELAGVPVDGALDARSLVPTMRGAPRNGEGAIAVTETTSGSIAARTERWKYVRLRHDRSERLFDLRADPGETTDVASRHPDVLARLREHTLEHVMLHRPGLYLVVIADEGAKELAVPIEGATGASSLFGLWPQPVPRGVRFAGRPSQPLAVVAAIEADGEITAGGATLTESDCPPYRPGDLARLLHAGAAGVHLFAGPDRVAMDASRDAARGIDPQQRKALQSVGYVGHGR